jgi:hypothetical protein
MKIKRVEHIAIAVDSLNQSASILRDAFGINIEYEEQRLDTACDAASRRDVYRAARKRGA